MERMEYCTYQVLVLPQSTMYWCSGVWSMGVDPIIWQDGGRHRTKRCRSNSRSRHDDV